MVTDGLPALFCFRSGETFSASNVRAIAGATDRKQGGRVLAFKSIDIHPGFESGNKPVLATFGSGNKARFDLAVATTAEPIKFDELVQPIALHKTVVPANAKVMGGGWGPVLVRALTFQRH